MRLCAAGVPTLVALLLASSAASAQPVLLAAHGAIAGIVHDPDRPLTLAAEMLAQDVQSVTGARPVVSTDLESCPQICIIVGKRGSPLVAKVARDAGIDLTALDRQWERYARVAVESRSRPRRRYLLIAGSDPRGAIWGVVDLSREIGVSAWEWWADVTPRHRDSIAVDGTLRFSKAPSVQYRGIFLNDEDWGLQPWAAKTFEPETGDIGPKTYARIFELLWRLKANLIWPAMHDSTKPFYQIPGNADAARDHAIIVGTSHAEPMMRNNVREWDEAERGPFNFFTNRKAMLDYWRTRAEAVKEDETVYTVGLRGKHDSAMEGARSPVMARDALADAIAAQHTLLSETQRKPASQIPQALTLYKEVLDLYGLGLTVPDDVTLVWPEDNFGYISQLPTAQERRRSGGGGVYYHISYWGRPHDYLWLATTHPALIREEMDRAWQTGARRLWVVNVGDIKPGEYLTQYFLDLAFDAETFGVRPIDHLTAWAATQFGADFAGEIAAVMSDYYDLAFERRPEFMGFNQVEPTTPITIGDYVRGGGAEAEQRIDRYAALRARAEALAARMPADRRAAFFELVLYPVRGAASLNERNLKLDLAALYMRQGRPVANLLADEARAAHARIVTDTAEYNALNGGKWRGIMNMAPRGLPVFAEPLYPHATFAARPGCVVDPSDLTFVAGRAANHALTIYSFGDAADWSMAGQSGIVSAANSGRLDGGNGFQQRIAIHYDGIARALSPGVVTCAGKTVKLAVQFVTPARPDAPVEIGHVITLTTPYRMSRDWEPIGELGAYGRALRVRLDTPSRGSASAVEPLRYSFATAETGDATLEMVALPTHPLTSADHLRIAVQIDDGAVQTLDFDTHGRSDVWKQNVLSNTARQSIRLPLLTAGAHDVRVFALDPGFLLDRIEVRRDGAAARYGAPLVR
ncbi:glycosyl hydrolase 115 family protein [Sphingomonas sp. GC_Shp_3]|uniref:glycosyl hydrolase 115 family protein n=1 Tax=Sphingomonas sp. GC_Shp_3 TaxID=2937383 RepID=UPI00226AD0FF|nr:glycosyl hydrolase 115 family protein [Sphingomonas sp. GC_Shp_3]